MITAIRVSADLLKSSSSVFFFEPLLLGKLSIAQFLEDALLFSQIGQFFLLHHLDQSLLQCLADKDLEDRLDLSVEVKQLHNKKLGCCFDLASHTQSNRTYF